MDQLATSIRTKDCRGVQRALELGASPNACISLDQQKEQLIGAQVPVVFLAIHYDLPPAIGLLARHGADVHRAMATGLTPRTHAAWCFRWKCLEAFDALDLPFQDDPMVLSTIATQWAAPSAPLEMEEIFFERLSRASATFTLTPDLGMMLLASVMCGPTGYRVGATRRLLENFYFKHLGETLVRAMAVNGEQFVPALTRLHSLASTFVQGHDLPEPLIQLLAEQGIPLCPPPTAEINEPARQWLSEQQKRINSCLDRKALDEGTGEAQGSRGRRL